MVESDTARVSDLPMVESDIARVSVLPVAGCKFPAVILGKVALDVVGLGVGPPWSPSGFGGNLADFDGRASPVGSCSSGVTGTLIICCCFYRFFKERDIVSGRSPDGDQADPSYALSRSERLYDFGLDIQNDMELRAVGPSAELVKTMSVRDSQCIRIVTPDDHVEYSFHMILLHEMREKESPFVATSELHYLRGDWPRVLLAFMTRYRQNLEHK